MIETFILFGMLRCILSVEEIRILHGNEDGIDHFVLCRSRMHIPSSDFHLSRSRIEIFEFQLPKRTAVHGIGDICPESLYIKMMRASSDFFVRCKGHMDITMEKILVLGDVFKHFHDLCNACLIIGSEKSRTVSDHEILTGISAQCRKFRCFQDDPVCLIKHQISAFILDDSGSDIFAAHVR